RKRSENMSFHEGEKPTFLPAALSSGKISLAGVLLPLRTATTQTRIRPNRFAYSDGWFPRLWNGIAPSQLPIGNSKVTCAGITRAQPRARQHCRHQGRAPRFPWLLPAGPARTAA